MSPDAASMEMSRLLNEPNRTPSPPTWLLKARVCDGQIANCHVRYPVRDYSFGPVKGTSARW